MISIWAAFDACDIDKSDSIEENELKFLMYCYEGHKLDKDRIKFEMQ